MCICMYSLDPICHFFLRNSLTVVGKKRCGYPVCEPIVHHHHQQCICFQRVLSSANQTRNISTETEAFGGFKKVPRVVIGWRERMLQFLIAAPRCHVWELGRASAQSPKWADNASALHCIQCIVSIVSIVCNNGFHCSPFHCDNHTLSSEGAEKKVPRCA